MALSRPILALRNSENTQNDQIWNHKNHPAPWSQPAVTYTYGAPWLALGGRSSFRTLIRGVDIRRLMETCARKDLTCGESIKIPAGSVKKKKKRYCMCVCEGKRSTPLKDLARLSDSPPQLLLRTSAHTGIRTAFCCRCSSQPPMYGGKRERERGEREEKEEGVH